MKRATTRHDSPLVNGNKTVRIEECMHRWQYELVEAHEMKRQRHEQAQFGVKPVF